MSDSVRFVSLRRWLRVERLEDRTNPTAITVDPTSFASDRVLVTLANGADVASALANVSASPYAASVERLGLGIYQVNLRAGVNVAAAIPALDAIRGVASAEADFTIGVSLTPNDPSFGNLWGMNNTGQSGGTVDADIDAPEAWDTARGTGEKIVAVIDTGVDYNHPDLAANMWRNPGETPGDGIDNDGNGIVDDVFGADFANNDGDPMDDNNHGTHCAGTIGAVGNNGIGVAGVAWKTRIMALKFLTGSGSGSTSNAIKCIDYAVSKGASILSNSWGGGGYSSALESAIVRARDAGAIFVAAAGNSGVNTDSSANYPSNYNVSNVISVAAIDRYNNLASFSNYGANTVDLGAPGVSILSTVPNGGYASYSGTSMATPHVAGALAVFWDANPTLTAQEVIQRMLSSVDQIPALAGKTVTGGGLNLAKLLETGGSPPSPPPPTGDTTGARITGADFAGSTPKNYNRVRVTFSEAMDATSFDVGDVVFTGPNGTITPTAVAPVAGSTTQFDITFVTQSAYGTYAISIGPGVLDLAGNSMDQNQNGTNGEASDLFTATAKLHPPRTKFSYSNLNTPIQDRSTVDYDFTVSADSVVSGFNISDVNFTISLNHTSTSDLRIYLISPEGTMVQLFNRRGGRGGENLNDTTFNDEATTGISQARAPFSGSFIPEQSLSAFDGQNPVGTWTLRVQDMARRNEGTILSFSLDIATSPGDSASTFGLPEEFDSRNIAIGAGIAYDLVGDRPVLLTPPTDSVPSVTLPGTLVSDDLILSGESPATSQMVGGMANFEPSSSEWLGLTTPSQFDRISF